jgi:signal peptidase I
VATAGPGLRSDKMARMKRSLALFVVAAVAAVGGCGGDAAASGTEQFTQGGVSMEPTIKAGQVITGRRVGQEYKPRRGDIVLFHASERWVDPKAVLLKRVVAVGGETIACCDVAGKVTVDGTALAEPYVANDAPLDVAPTPEACGARRFGPVPVPEGTVFVIGDNRAASNDSRCAGPVPTTSVFAVMTSGPVRAHAAAGPAARTGTSGLPSGA